jgi:hypothetical protein
MEAVSQHHRDDFGSQVSRICAIRVCGERFIDYRNQACVHSSVASGEAIIVVEPAPGGQVRGTTHGFRSRRMCNGAPSAAGLATMHRKAGRAE